MPLVAVYGLFKPAHPVGFGVSLVVVGPSRVVSAVVVSEVMSAVVGAVVVSTALISIRGNSNSGGGCT